MALTISETILLRQKRIEIVLLPSSRESQLLELLSSFIITIHTDKSKNVAKFPNSGTINTSILF